MLVALAIVGGTSSQQVASAAPGIFVVGMPCDMVMSGQTADDGADAKIPCKTMTVDCLKQLGCATDIALLARPDVAELIAQHKSDRKSVV